MMYDPKEPLNNVNNELMSRAEDLRRRCYRMTGRDTLSVAKEIVQDILKGSYPSRPREREFLLRNARDMGIA